MNAHQPHPLAATTDRLNETIVKVEQWLIAKRLGVSASMELSDQSDLRFEKVGCVWRLVLDSQPLANASRQSRALAMKAIPELLAALKAEAELQHTGILQVIEDVERFMAEHP